MTLDDFDIGIARARFEHRPTDGGRWITERYFPDIEYPLFRSTKTKFLSALMQSGEFRVGTLWDFRDNKIYGDRIGDAEEGVRGCVIKTSDGDRYACNINQDQYVVCTSTEPNLNAFAEDGNDALYEITSPEFFWEVVNALDKQIMLDSINLVPVVYVDDQDIQKYAQKKYLSHFVGTNRINMFPAAAIKPLAYSPQKEIRAIMRVVNDPWKGAYPDPLLGREAHLEALRMKSRLRPRIIHIPNARKYVSVIQV